MLGFNDAADYAAHTSYFGCVIGRVGNRIALIHTNNGTIVRLGPVYW